jgi:hypothetical protein
MGLLLRLPFLLDYTFLTRSGLGVGSVSGDAVIKVLIYVASDLLSFPALQFLVPTP